ncbi:hypothetical protein ACSAZL_12500 [Methanosarcina sp. T3]|uniref:hypothetical protein n=1 Tax=Methanosarcina sp. T3 TaxID=3439062 RepID=UPI003F84EBA1
MFKPNPNFKSEIDEETLEKILTNILEKVVYENGCTLCKGKNLTVYVNEFTGTYVDGYAYCHNCNEKISAHVNIDIEGEMEKIETELKKVFER